MGGDGSCARSRSHQRRLRRYGLRRSRAGWLAVPWPDRCGVCEQGADADHRSGRSGNAERDDCHACEWRAVAMIPVPGGALWLRPAIPTCARASTAWRGWYKRGDYYWVL